MAVNDKISCIIPMYNAEKYIQKCISSVLAQTYQNFEIIVVDDGSTDSSYALAEECRNKDSRIRLYHTPNGGVCKARNLGLEHAEGDFIAFLDADDSLPEEAFGILLADIRNHHADIAMGKDASSSTHGQKSTSAFSNELVIWRDNEALEAALKDVPHTWQVVGKLFRKELLQGLYFVVGKNLGEDSYFFFQCCLRKPTVSYRRACVYQTYLSPNSATRSRITQKKIEDMVYFADAKIEEITQKSPRHLHLAINIKIRAYMLILRQILSLANPEPFNYWYGEAVAYIRKNSHHFVRKPHYSSVELLFDCVNFRCVWLYKFIILIKIKSRNLV